MKKVLYAILIICLMAVPISATTLYSFTPNFGNSEFEFKQIASADDDWFPLRECAEDLPIAVSWDERARAVIVESDAVRLLRPSSSIQSYDIQRIRAMPDDIKIVDGVTYCSGRFLVQHLQGIAFQHDGDVYYYAGQGNSADYIINAESPRFEPYVITALCRLYLKSPVDYKLIRDNLSGGIAYVHPEKAICCDALGYVYPEEEPVCYIVGDTQYGARLASLIAHEAMHIFQYRQGVNSSEEDAEMYEVCVLRKLLEN